MLKLLSLHVVVAVLVLLGVLLASSFSSAAEGETKQDAGAAKDNVAAKKKGAGAFKCSDDCYAKNCEHGAKLTYGHFCGAVKLRGCKKQKPCDALDACCKTQVDCLRDEGLTSGGVSFAKTKEDLRRLKRCTEDLVQCVNTFEEDRKAGKVKAMLDDDDFVPRFYWTMDLECKMDDVLSTFKKSLQTRLERAESRLHDALLPESDEL
ncbi:hypothetical protein NFJ02_07g132230 [Pycnococcus provasolii]